MVRGFLYLSEECVFLLQWFGIIGCGQGARQLGPCLRGEIFDLHVCEDLECVVVFLDLGEEF